MTLIDRVTATQKTIDKFFEKPFVWGSGDCAILAAYHLKQLNIKTDLAKVRGYKSETGAKRALVKLGVRGMDELADAKFERIAPAAALVGDIVGLPGGEEGNEWVALGVVLDGSHVLAYANGRALRGPISACTLAWRVG